MFGFEHMSGVLFRQPCIVIATQRFRFARESHFVDNDTEIGRHYEIPDGYANTTYDYALQHHRDSREYDSSRFRKVIANTWYA